MRDRIAGLLDKADLAIAACDGVVEPAALGPIAATVRNVRIRASYPDDLIVAALAGGTGSGKSSLLNAVAGTDMVQVGGVRPTTGEPVALATERRLSELAGYLDMIGVDKRMPGDVPDWMCLIDLPDTDSVETDHRLRVESLLPRLDVVIWVVDPEKYRDASLHNSHLKTLSDYSSQFVFVLNQADRLEDDARFAVGADFVAALGEDGIAEPVVVVTAANPPAGPALGVGELLTALEERAGDDAAMVKLLIDLGGALASLVAVTGGGSTGFEARALEARSRDEIADLAGAIADETSGPTATRIREIAVRETLDRDAIGEVRDVLRRRAFANATLVELSVAVTEAETRLQR